MDGDGGEGMNALHGDKRGEGADAEDGLTGDTGGERREDDDDEDDGVRGDAGDEAVPGFSGDRDSEKALTSLICAVSTSKACVHVGRV